MGTHVHVPKDEQDVETPSIRGRNPRMCTLLSHMEAFTSGNTAEHFRVAGDVTSMGGESKRNLTYIDIFQTRKASQCQQTVRNNSNDLTGRLVYLQDYTTNGGWATVVPTQFKTAGLFVERLLRLIFSLVSHYEDGFMLFEGRWRSARDVLQVYRTCTGPSVQDLDTNMTDQQLLPWPARPHSNAHDLFGA